MSCALDDFYDDTSSDGGMSIRPEDEHISLSTALESLQRARELLDKFKDQDEAWLHPKELLDKTAAALDEAALALRSDGNISSDDDGDGDDTDTNEEETSEDEVMKVKKVGQIAEEVLRGRQLILDKANAVVTSRTKSQVMREQSMIKKRETLLVYATHTGTSKKFIVELCDNLGLERSNIKNMKHLTLADVQERKRVIFVCSTFGCGRPPRDGEVFFTSLQLLSESVNAGQALYGVEVAVAALGNSKFNSFCVFGKQLSDKLRELRAAEILPMATIDAKMDKVEQRNQFLKWQDEILEMEGKSPKNKRTMSNGGANGIEKKSEGNEKSSCCILL